MAELIILTPEQLAERDQPRGRGRSGRRRSEARTRIIESYKASLQGAEPGHGGDVLLEEGDEKRVVRQNLLAAANDLGLALAFRPVRDPNRLQFRVVTPEERAARPRHGGRPGRQESTAPEQPAEETPANSTVNEETGTPKRRRRQRRTEAAE